MSEPREVTIRQLPPPDLAARRALRPVPPTPVPLPPPTVPLEPVPVTTGEPWEDRAIIQIWRTTEPLKEPPADLREGELAVELATSPPRLWCGVPQSISANGRIRLNAVLDLGDVPGGPFLSIAGGTLTGQLNAPFIYVSQTLMLANPPVNPMDAANKDYVDTVINNLPYLALTGGTLTGQLDAPDIIVSGFVTLANLPTAPNHAVNRAYVDTAVGGVAGWTRLTAVLTPPAVLGTVTASVESTSWMDVGLPVFIGGGIYEVTAIPSATSITLRRVK